MPFDKSQYDLFWKDVIRPRILQRDNFKCCDCGVKQYANYYTCNKVRHILNDPHEIAWAKRMGYKVKKIFLAVSHGDHDTANNQDSNLKSRCQFCHLRHDKEYHRLSRRAKKRS